MLQAADRASGLLAVSEALADDMAALGFSREKITVHYTGLDRARFRPLARDESRAWIGRNFGIDLDGTAPVLATVGALIPRKGQRIVLQALQLLPDARLLLVGDGPDRAALEEQVRTNGLDEQVHFLGSLDHDSMPRVLSAANAMVLLSASEGLANAWVEALACGTPIVISDAGGAKELLRDPSAGRIVARTPDAIADAVYELLENPPAQDTVAASVAQFSWEENARKLAEYYEGLVANA
jgi:glycosyltransferase involved in cell wall biosynthesis